MQILHTIILLENGHESFTITEAELLLGAKADSTVGELMVRVVAEVVVREVVELVIKEVVGAETERSLHACMHAQTLRTHMST